MKKLFSSFLFLLLAVGAMSASPLSFTCGSECCAADKDEESPETSQQWLKEIREFKHNYLAKELNLTKEQQKAFFPLYDAMEDETWKINRETRDLEQKVKSSSSVSDLEYDKATDAIFEQKEKEGAVERAYLQKFREVLTREQLFKLRGAERRFAGKLMQHHHRLTQGDKGSARKGSKAANN